jgi:hypothetical protein
MGVLSYDNVSTVDFEDRALAHLEVVIANKFRRNESFNFSWIKDSDEGSGRVTIWMHPAIPLVYEYSGGRTPSINRAWLEALMQTANSAGGLRLVPEPKDEPVPAE